MCDPGCLVLESDFLLSGELEFGDSEIMGLDREAGKRRSHIVLYLRKVYERRLKGPVCKMWFKLTRMWTSSLLMPVSLVCFFCPPSLAFWANGSYIFMQRWLHQ